MTKQELKEKILEILRKEKIGFTITRIADISQVSRPTIYKYLAILEKERLVEEVDVGGSKFWTARSLKSSSSLSSIMFPYRYFIDNMLSTADSIYGTEKPINWKDFGYKMSETINIQNIFETEVFYQALVKENILPLSLGGKFDASKESKSNINHLKLLKQFSNFFEEVFKFVFAFLDDCEIEPSFELEDPPYLIIRMKNFKFLRDHRVVQIMTGITESTINELFEGLGFEMTPSIDIPNKIVTFKIHFFVDHSE